VIEAAPPAYLTTRELADLLRIKERKVYDMAAAGDVPCTKVTGKLLFPRDAVQAWIDAARIGPAATASRDLPAVFLGSHDPLLDWAVRESRCGMAVYFDGSMDGLRRLVEGGGQACGIHLLDERSGGWNRSAVEALAGNCPFVLLGWARRQRGLILCEPLAGRVNSLDGLRGYRLAPRQPEAGAQRLFEYLCRQADIGIDDLRMTEPARSEADAALAVLEGRADATFGLAAVAAQYRLDFVPLIDEQFDLLVDRRAWFEPPLQGFWKFCQSSRFAERAALLAGYDISDLGSVRYNGP